MIQPKISVIVPCYNHQDYVESCLLSVFNQTYKYVEVIVIDDGSVDESREVIRKLKHAYDFTFITQENIGLIKTLNKGLALATGTYYAPFASDDWMPPDRIGRQVEFMQSHPEIVACGGNCLLVDKNSVPCLKQKKFPARTLDFDDIFLSRKPGLPAPTALIHTEAVKQFGGYREDIGIEDTWLWLKLTSLGYKIAVLDTIDAHYRTHGENMHSRLRYMVESSMKIFDEYSHHPQYEHVVSRYLLGNFQRAAKYDKNLAWQILSRYRGSLLNRKLLAGLVRLILLPQSRKPCLKSFNYSWGGGRKSMRIAAY